LKVFISYYWPDDQDWVEKLSGGLSQKGILPVMINLKHMFRRANIFKEIESAVGDCQRIVLVLSQSYSRSTWHETERLAFLLHEQKCSSELVFAVRKENCPVPETISDASRVIDFTSQQFPDAFDSLMRVLRKSPQCVVVAASNESQLAQGFDSLKKLLRHQGYASTLDVQPTPSRFSERTLRDISVSDLVLVDASLEAPVCSFVGGFATALKKNVFYVTAEGKAPPLDLPIMTWRDRTQFEKELKALVQQIKKRHNPAPRTPGRGSKGREKGAPDMVETERLLIAPNPK
jgi:hypothetical protein